MDLSCKIPVWMSTFGLGWAQHKVLDSKSPDHMSSTVLVFTWTGSKPSNQNMLKLWENWSLDPNPSVQTHLRVQFPFLPLLMCTWRKVYAKTKKFLTIPFSPTPIFILPKDWNTGLHYYLHYIVHFFPVLWQHGKEALKSVNYCCKLRL